MKRNVAMFAVVIMAVGAVGFLLCGSYFKGDSLPKNPTIGNSIYYMPLEDRVQTLNPREVRFRSDYQIMKAIYDQFIGISRDGYVAPRVCYRWEISDDFKRYTFYLKDGVFFHDGKKLTSRDILFSFHYAGKNPTILYKLFTDIDGYEEYYRGKADHISGIKIIDDYTIQITLKDSKPIFLYKLSDPRFVILPENFHGIDEADFFKMPIGAGPYMLKFWDENKIVISRFDNYYGQKGYIKEFHIIPMERQDVIKTFENGKIFNLPYSLNIKTSEINRTDIAFQRADMIGVHMLFFNNQKYPLTNKFVRLAIRAAIDRDRLVEKCYPENEVASGIIPTGLVGSANSRGEFYDLNNSVEYYLNKAGLKTKDLPLMHVIRFKETQDNCFKPTIEKMFKNAKLPITVEILSYEDGMKLFSDNDYHILSEWITVRNLEPLNIIHFFDGRSTQNLAKIDDIDINKLIDLAEGARSRASRAAIYKEISDHIVRKAYVVDMDYLRRDFIYDQRVRGPSIPDPISQLVGFNEIWLED
ncbi:MAG: ABC transporter substrate-binding protein [Deltaproteobacteria bacterium]|nr:ABC transporter substrate-binding protein [Deltaproteobacteria bacterium]